MSSVVQGRPPVAVPMLDLEAQRVRLGGRVEEAIARVVAHGQFIMGPEVKTLEERLAAYCGVKHAVACASGTDALLLPLMAWGIGPGDAVFVPTFTFAATAEVVALVGATPVFVDSDPATFNMSPESLRAALAATAGATDLRPAAVIPVDLFGQAADYESIASITTEHGLRLLSDAAQSFGGARSGRRCGSFGDASATSFFPAKPLGCYGDGGAVLTDDDDLDAVLRSLRVHGQGTDKYDNVRIGVNGRLDTIQAAVLIEKLAILDEEIAARNAVADRYDVGLISGVLIPAVAPGVYSAWAQYTVQVPDRTTRADLLRKCGVATAVYYPKPLHRQPAFSTRSLTPVPLAVAEKLSTVVLSLPIYPYLDEAAQMQVIEALNQTFL